MTTAPKPDPRKQRKPKPHQAPTAIGNPVFRHPYPDATPQPTIPESILKRRLREKREAERKARTA